MSETVKNEKKPDIDRIRLRAIADYNRGVKPKDIAAKYDVNINTLKSWLRRGAPAKSKGAKKAEKKPPSKPKKTAPKPEKSAPKPGDIPYPKKRGAPYGNTNAVGGRGGGAPLGNKNALKHGGYSAIYLDQLSEEERELLDEFEPDPEEILVHNIKLYTIRERRLLATLNDLKEKKQIIDTVERSEKRREFDSEEDKELYLQRIQEKIDSGERLPGREYNMRTFAKNPAEFIAKVEEALSRCQEQLHRSAIELGRIRAEKDGNKGGVAEAWVHAVFATLPQEPGAPDNGNEEGAFDE